MGTWSQEFINIARYAPMTPAAALQAIVEGDFALDAAERVPKVVYFPPRSGAQVWWLTVPDQVLELPPHITVMIAPGAMIGALGARSRLSISGELQAPIGPIFPSRTHPPDGVAGADVGQVELISPRLEALYPEWWGGGVDLSPDADSGAMEEVVRVADLMAAFVGRTPVIELLGRYRLNRTLRLLHEPGGAERRSLEFRGRPGGEDDATFSAADDFEGEVLFEVGPFEGRVQCRNVRFDARLGVRACVRVRARPAQGLPDTLRLAHEFTQCAFRGGIDAGLQVVDAEPDAPAATPSGLPPETVPLVEANGCVFRAVASPPGKWQSAPKLGVGARLFGPPGGSTRFFNCFFLGEALAMIHATNHDVVTTGCRFENGYVPPPLRSGGVPDWRTFYRNGLAGGVDIFLDAVPTPPRAELMYTTIGVRVGPPEGVTSEDNRVRSQWSTFIEPSRPPRVTSLATLTAQDCRSSSPQFLVALSSDGHAAVRDSTVIGLHHAFDVATVTGTFHLPPAILWLARDGAPSGPSLQLIGCRIDREVLSTTPMVVAPGGGDGRPTVFDYGTSTNAEVLSTPVGHGLSRFPGVFAPTQVGYVPFRR
jgi:hypothetical protein